MITKQEAAYKLAQAHFLVEEGMVSIYRLVSPTESDAEPIKLLEINRDTIPTGIMPLSFSAAPERGIPYPSIIIEVTPEEFDQIRAGTVSLPHGWQIAEAIANEQATVPVTLSARVTSDE